MTTEARGEKERGKSLFAVFGERAPLYQKRKSSLPERVSLFLYYLDVSSRLRVEENDVTPLSGTNPFCVPFSTPPSRFSGNGEASHRSARRRESRFREKKKSETRNVTERNKPPSAEMGARHLAPIPFDTQMGVKGTGKK